MHNCLLVSIRFSSPKSTSLNFDFYELKALVRAANWKFVETTAAKRLVPDPKYFCGKGKIEEIQSIVKDKEINLVIFNSTITSSQERNIKKLLSCEVIDRTRLILEIFSQRAQTHEGKLQVELANLNYSATRLVRSWTHLERQKGGIGIRGGPGETQLEIDRRLLRKRISKVEKSLEMVKKNRGLSRALRKKNKIPTIAFVGYTNAGKSTLFNTLSGSSVLTKDQLFATLDPTLRSINVPKLGKVVLSDTVGFIRDLPHHLIEAFCATLEEVSEADLLLHVIDYTDNNYNLYMEQVNAVLEKIHAKDKPIVHVYNKIDRLKDFKSKVIENIGKPTEVFLSAYSGNGIYHLYKVLAKYFNKEWMNGTIMLMPNESKLRSQFYQLGSVVKECVNNKGEYLLTLNIAKDDFDEICRDNKLELFKKISHH